MRMIVQANLEASNTMGHNTQKLSLNWGGQEGKKNRQGAFFEPQEVLENPVWEIFLNFSKTNLPRFRHNEEPMVILLLSLLLRKKKKECGPRSKACGPSFFVTAPSWSFVSCSTCSSMMWRLLCCSQGHPMSAECTHPPARPTLTFFGPSNHLPFK